MKPARLQKLSDVKGRSQCPSYQPEQHGVGIVHLGLGAFHRAHQAAITDAALAAVGGDWRIIAVSMRSRAVADALLPQNGLYTLIERDAQGVQSRVIASIAEVIAADKAATLAALCRPEIKVVTLTVTEKGYGIDRSTQRPDESLDTIAEDLAHPEAPRGVLGLLTAALAFRRQNGMNPFTVLCCDNLPDNGTFLRNGVLGFARAQNAGLADWIAQNVDFPSSMVDRITPAATQTTRDDAARLCGCEDAAAIETEPFSQWVIEDRFRYGRPAWEHGGALFVADVTPYEAMKLRMLNGAHSMLAYAGYLAGHTYVRDVMNDPALAGLVRRHLAAAAGGLAPLPGIDFGQYATALEARFRNPAIAHETYQIASDGTEKLPQRIFAPAEEALATGADIRPFAFATAAWMRFCMGASETGARYALQDPRSGEITALLSGMQAEAGAVANTLLDLPALFPQALRESGQWRATVRAILEDMISQGMGFAIAKEAGQTRSA